MTERDTMFTEPARQPATSIDPVRPRIIFTTELDAHELLEILSRPGIPELLAANHYTIALALPFLDNEHADVVRRLNAHEIPVVAWLMLPADAGYSFNAQNYPQLQTCYRAFHNWVSTHALVFDAVGLEIAPPADVTRSDHLSARYLARRLWLAGDNVLFPAARAAYTELVTLARHEGYEVHAYQWPLIADDRRAGTSLLQRALEIVDIPSDVDVLMCSSNVPLGRLGRDLGGALIASYGPAADAIGIGGGGDPAHGAVLPWPALRRDLLLAAQHTDVIYLDSLEGCVRRGLLPLIIGMDWSARVRAEPGRRVLIATLRGLMLGTLLGARFGPRVLAWTGWVLAVLLWLRGRARHRDTRHGNE